MGEPGDGKQRDDGAVVRQRVHAAARHRGDAVQHLERNLGGFGCRDERIGHRRQRDAHAARGRSGDAGQHGHADRLVDQRIGNRLERVGDQHEARQQRDHAAEAVFGRGVHRREQRAGDRGLAAVGELGEHRPPGEREHGQDAEQQRALDRPDRGHLADLGDDGLGMPERDRRASRRRPAESARVSTKFATPTTTSGESAIQGLGSFSSSNGSGSLRSSVP